MMIDTSKLLGQQVEVMADGKLYMGYVQQSKRWKCALVRVHSLDECFQFTWDAVKRAVEDKETLIA